VLASFDTYYTVFGALLIAVAGIAAALARRCGGPSCRPRWSSPARPSP
jgi:hypothetical protein